eukprot:640568-Amphidinium_carterae.1
MPKKRGETHGLTIGKMTNLFGNNFGTVYPVTLLHLLRPRESKQDPQPRSPTPLRILQQAVKVQRLRHRSSEADEKSDYSPHTREQHSPPSEQKVP